MHMQCSMNDDIILTFIISYHVNNFSQGTLVDK